MLFASIYTCAKAQTPADCPADVNAPISEYCEDGHGISTDPDNLVNDDCPNLKNNFEWRVKHPQGGAVPNEWYQAYDESGVRKNLANPFNDPDPSDYRHIADNHNTNYHPEDGWELLKVDFGTLSNFSTGWGPLQDPGLNTATGGVKLPYMILYNKYTGTFRFYGSLLGQNDDYQTIRIELRIPSESVADPENENSNYQDDLKATNLLSIQGETIQPLDQETEESSISFFATASNNESKFFYFDMPTAFDPCLCNIRSQLDISFSFVSQADINIVGGVPVDGVKNNSSGKASKVVPTVFAAVLSTVVAVKTGGTVINFKAYADLIGLAKDIPGLNSTQKSVLTDLGNFAKCSANFAKVVKKSYKGAQSLPSGNPVKPTAKQKAAYAAAEKLLDGTTTYVSALTTGCEGSDKAGTAVSQGFTAVGTLTSTTEILGTTIQLAMPGSKWSDKRMQENSYIENSKTIPAYSTYNERLGTFALLEKPELKIYHRGDMNVINMQAPKLVINATPGYHKVQEKVHRIVTTGGLKYVFNPKMNVNLDETVIQYRFATKQDLDVQNTGLSLHGVSFTPRDVVKNENLLYSTTTPFLPIEYYENAGPILLPLKESNFTQQFVNVGGSIVPTHFNPNQPTFEYSELFIQFKILMTSNDEGRDGPNQAYYIFTYPVNVTEIVDVQDPEPLPLPDPLTTQSLQQWTFMRQFQLAATASVFTSSEPGLNGSNKSFNQDLIFQDDDVLFYDGLVDISAKLSTLSGKKVTIYSTIGFELLPGAEIGSNIELVIGYPFASSPIPPQTYSQVTTFCGDNNKYKAQEFSTSALREEKEEYEHRADMAREAIEKQNSQNLELKLYPNPTNNEFSIELDYALENLTVSVLDVNGKQVFTKSFSGEQSKVKLDASQLEAGIYFIDVRTLNGKIGRERLVKY